MRRPSETRRPETVQLASADSARVSATAARYIAATSRRTLSAAVLDAAKACLVDWCGVAVGALHEPAATAVRKVVRSWGGTGQARVLLGWTTSAPLAALVNGTMAHCLDFDDTHVGAIAHLSAPTWAATLALAQQRGSSGAQALAAFSAGFEVGGKLGSGGLGEKLTERGFHSTGVIGRLAAAAAAGALLGLDEQRAAHALGLAATQTGGFTGSFGTMAKPFHAGKAGMDGVLSAEFAAEGFEAAPRLLDTPDGLVGTMVQDGSAGMGAMDFSESELLRNTFKPYASCLLTHPSIDAARSLTGEIGRREVCRVRATVHPLVVQVAGKPSPRTPLEAKFSLAYCVAIGLKGHKAQAGDFSPQQLNDPAVRALLERVQLDPSPGIAKTAAALEVDLADGATLRAEVPIALGNPERPMSWTDMENKFMALVQPALGKKAEALFAALRRFEQPGASEEVASLLEDGRA